MEGRIMLNITKITTLPDDLSALVTEAHSENFFFLERLVQEFEAGDNRFDKTGEALFEVRINTRFGRHRWIKH